MWFYIGIFATIVAMFLKRVPTPTDLTVTARHTYTVTREVYKVIRRNGLGVCLIWTQQVIANQIGSRLVEMHHRYYVVHYPYGVTWYKIIIPRHRRPCRIDTVVDENDSDVKKDVFAFMGPSHNFHGAQVTPNMLGYKSLTFTDLTDNSHTFAEDEAITI